MPSITYCQRYPITDILPVTKGRYFSENLKLLFYARMAYIDGAGFLFDLMKFEKEPIVGDDANLSDNDSLAVVSFTYTGLTTDTTLTVLINSYGNNQVYADKSKFMTLPDVNTYKGNDEQGWYWGVRFILTKELLDTIYDPFTILPGSNIRGNIYASLNNSEYAHFVSIAPFVNQNILDIDNYTTFSVL